MKMWSVNVMILLLFCYARLSTGTDSGVRFVSTNFINVLQWHPKEPAAPGETVLYSVTYWNQTSKQKHLKPECQNITDLSCDLTAETPPKYDVGYFAKVYANGVVYGRTSRFTPLYHTTFGPPTLSVHTTVSALSVDATLPLGPDGVSVADIVRRRKHWSITVPIYTLKITDPQWAAQERKSKTGQFVINLKNNHTEYCGYVVYDLSPECCHLIKSANFCATLRDDPWIVLRWPLVTGAVLTALVIVSVVCVCKYVKGGGPERMPQAMVTTSGTRRVLQFPDRNLILSEIMVCSEQTVYATIRAMPKVPSHVGSGGYSPQEIPCEPWQDSSGSSVGTGAHSINPNPEDTSAQSSENYGAVAVHTPAEENDEDFQQATTETCHPPSSSSGDNGGMSPKLTSRGAPPLPDPDAYENSPAGQLLLDTVRDANGQLMLPLLTFQLPGNAGDQPSPTNPERKPLLSDLIDSTGPSLASLQSLDSSEWSDSGCDDSILNTLTNPYSNSHYFPSQPGFHPECQSDATFESGYKQHWTPGILHGDTSVDSCEYRRTSNYPWTWTAPRVEEEGEEDEGRGEWDGSRPILIGGLMVQLQE